MIDHKEWKRRYMKLRGIADRVSRMRMDRARKVWTEATGYGWDGCAVHNASITPIGVGWCAGPNGHKIRSAARLAKRIERSSFEPSEIVSLWDRRVRGLF